MMFQSPYGVLGVCRADFAVLSILQGELFQSPYGVLGVCRKPSLLD